MKRSPTELLLLNLFNFFLTTVNTDLPKQHSSFKIFQFLFPIDPGPVYKKQVKKIGRDKFNDLLRSVMRSGYLKQLQGKDRGRVAITPKGWKRLLKAGPVNLGFKALKNNDRVMIVFDIPESRRNIRDVFRKDLKLLGFRQFQKSVWISAYDVLNVTRDLIDAYGFGGEVWSGMVSSFYFGENR